ncbi:hypothetical protein DMA11_17980 [Marinilabiliaceae bacterium JC017]|nr:hypothetical protein DMA11_17980 [Marinilabiliaceae bacterium JC017]
MKDNWDNNWSEYIKTTLDEYQPPIPDKLWDQLETSFGGSQAPNIGLVKYIGVITLGIGVIIIAYLLYQNNDIVWESVSDAKTKVELQTIDTMWTVENVENKEDVFKSGTPNQTLVSATDIEQQTTEAVNKTTRENNHTEFSSETNIHIQSQKKDAISNIKNNTKYTNGIHLDANDDNLNCKHEGCILKPSLENYKQQKEMKNYGCLNYLPLFLEKVQPHLAQINAGRSSIFSAQKHKRRVRKELLYRIGGGMQYFDFWNAYFDPSIEYRVDRFGLFGGILYNINNVREIIRGEGADESTVNILTKSILQHRISLMGGVNFSLLPSSKHQLVLNGGVISKSIILNGEGGSSIPLMIKSGLEFRLPVFKKYQSGIYYNYLYNFSGSNQSGHQVGVCLLFGRKIKR